MIYELKIVKGLVIGHVKQFAKQLLIHY